MCASCSLKPLRNGASSISPTLEKHGDYFCNHPLIYRAWSSPIQHWQKSANGLITEVKDIGWAAQKVIKDEFTNILRRHSSFRASETTVVIAFNPYQ
jgi:hypothetical protein